MKKYQYNWKRQFIIAFLCIFVLGLSVNAQRGGHGGGGFIGSSRGGSSFSGGGGSSFSSRGPSFSGGGVSHSIPSPTYSTPSPTYNRTPSPTYSRTPSSGISPVNVGVGQGTAGRGVAQGHSTVGTARGGVFGGVGYGGRGVSGGVGYGHGGYGRGYFSPYYVYPYYPTLGLRLGFLPFGYYSFYWDDYPYYYYNSVFYRRTDDNNYEVVTPPLGAHVPTIPNNSRAVMIDGNKYYESSGTYYQEEIDANNQIQYVVVGVDGVLNQPQSQVNREPQVGDIVPQLPNGCTTVFLNGQKYYEGPNNIYYQEVQDGDRIVYKIVGK